MKTYPGKEIRHISLIEGICKRPQMYTTNGSPEEVFLILDGIFLATRCYFGWNMQSNTNTKIDIDFIVEKYNGPIGGHNPLTGFFNRDKILAGIKAEGYETNEEIFGRILELLEENRPTENE